MGWMALTTGGFSSFLFGCVQPDVVV